MCMWARRTEHGVWPASGCRSARVRKALAARARRALAEEAWSASQPRKHHPSMRSACVGPRLSARNI
eukprot:3962973-Pyramimonas_sp.AAC.2